MIICAAVWFPIEEKFQFSPTNIDHGLVVAALRHGHCFYNASLLNDVLADKKRAVTPVQGFLTSDNRFVDRVEAGKIAKECGQVTKLMIDPELCSEDLY